MKTLKQVNVRSIQRACMLNAKSLLDEAVLQLKRGNFAYSVMFSITSIEESLKCGLVSAFESNHIDSQKLFSIWNSHKPKLLTKYARISVYEKIRSGEMELEWEIPEKSDFVSQALIDREKSLYVDIGKGMLSCPSEMNYKIASKYLKEASHEYKGQMIILSLGDRLDSHNTS